MMRNRRLIWGALIAIVPLFALGAAHSSPTAKRAGSKPIRLDKATVIVEINSTAGDAGFQVFLDGEPWSSMSLFGPDGRRILEFDTRAQVKNYGLTELFSESSEPNFKDFPLKKFKKLFPEGTYRFAGTTIEGRRMVGSAKMSHDFPDGAQITSPAPGSTLDAKKVVASWNPVPETGGVDVIGYRAIVERDDPLRIFSVDLPASVTSVTVSEEFLEPGTKYKLEVQVIEASGNLTTSEVEFSVS